MALYLGTDRISTTIEKEYLGIPLEVSAQGVLQKPATPFTWKSQGSDVVEVGLRYVFDHCSGITSADLSSFTTISGNYALQNTFNGCTNLTSVNLSSLTTISGSQGAREMCSGCTKLTNVDLSNLTNINVTMVLAYAFNGCTSLKTLSFPSLTSNSFGSTTNQFNAMLAGVTGCTVHFPSNLQSVIGSWSDVTNGFFGTNTTVLFDLPATT